MTSGLRLAILAVGSPILIRLLTIAATRETRVVVRRRAGQIGEREKRALTRPAP